MALAVRNLRTDLRSSGETTRGPKPFTPRDRSASCRRSMRRSGGSTASARKAAKAEN